MVAAETTAHPGLHVAPAELFSRLGFIMRELEQSCHGLQDALSATLNSDSRMASSLMTQLQEIDRVSQTLGSLAEFAAALQTQPYEYSIDIQSALRGVRLNSVRDVLIGSTDLPLDNDEQNAGELF